MRNAGAAYLSSLVGLAQICLHSPESPNSARLPGLISSVILPVSYAAERLAVCRRRFVIAREECSTRLDRCVPFT
jgi:hypothetical protein